VVVHSQYSMYATVIQDSPKAPQARDNQEMAFFRLFCLDSVAEAKFSVAVCVGYMTARNFVVSTGSRSRSVQSAFARKGAGAWPAFGMDPVLQCCTVQETS